ncbi:DUF6992 family protein [Catalinimonas niigatensis]|uniref:DUF6992 family protein n=1 Tax=Catalinimonas niigatensis TaxID=1397264 RepID=UPI002665980C|nr:hypothetical protein [Catalinimonas niigatensis]WPP53135.1 hypothetical protein PZB72_12180 [Catalinimonas niigatensis]
MKKCIFTLALCWFTFQAYGQANENLTNFNKNRQQITNIGMITLGSWAIGNIAVNGLLMSRASGSTYYFYQMNALWNVVNLGLAGFGYYNSLQMNPETVSLANSVDEFYGLQKTLLFNAGLDVAYLAGGFYLIEKAKNSERNRERFMGYGRSIILQGAFLLAFDSILYFILENQSEDLLPLLNTSANGIGFRLRF